MESNVDVGLTLSAPNLPIPVGPIGVSFIDSNVAFGDTALAPAVIGWNSGNFYWNAALFVLAPTGDYSTSQLANTSLHRWALMPRIAGTYFDPKTGWQASANIVYSVSFENPATDYETGEILNLEGSITTNFGALGVGGVAYAMIQTTPDSGAGARLGAFESKVYGAGPIITYSMGGLTLLAKWYAEFDAENTFEGNIVDAAASFKF
jgi:hypothetical protein